mmetsp:Transcript_25611/g.71561  ORF Transcript_25611/g.71561 Transcript_25611/m.71561 type:complete len:217 (+) Transcript_25611:1339-1989(+)
MADEDQVEVLSRVALLERGGIDFLFFLLLLRLWFRLRGGSRRGRGRFRFCAIGSFGDLQLFLGRMGQRFVGAPGLHIIPGVQVGIIGTAEQCDNFGILGEGIGIADHLRGPFAVSLGNLQHCLPQRVVLVNVVFIGRHIFRFCGRWCWCRCRCWRWRRTANTEGRRRPLCRCRRRLPLVCRWVHDRDLEINAVTSSLFCFFFFVLIAALLLVSPFC